MRRETNRATYRISGETARIVERVQLRADFRFSRKARCPRCRKPASEAGFRLVGAARFELATFRPPAELQSVSMRPGASDASISSTRVDILDALDVAVGTKAVPRQLERLAEGS